MSSNYGSRRSSADTVGRPSDLYPSPFFDISGNYMPKSLKETFDWCSYYQTTHPLINTVVQRLATYPVTELVYETSNKGVQDMYKDLFERKIHFRQAAVEHNLDRYTYGTTIATMSFPFRKMLECSSCKERSAATDVARKWDKFKFIFECPKCKHRGPGRASDEMQKTRDGIRIIRWNPKTIDIEYNELTGRFLYYYNMPTRIKNDIVLGRPGVIEHIPQAFIDAVANKKSIMLPADKVFHARRAAVSRDPKDAGWGAPLVLPVLKDVFLSQILRKSQEAVALEHVVPMRVVYPQITTDAGNIYAQVNLQDWQSEVETQLSKWRRDPNHIPVMPVPVGYQMIGGQGRNLMLHQEMRALNDVILAGMGVTPGFIYGDSFTSGSVNMRALENEFLGNVEDMNRFATFVKDSLVAGLGIPDIPVKFKPFKTSDDIQRASFNLQLNQLGKLSTRTLLESQDHDYETETTLIADESRVNLMRQREQSKATAEMQGEGAVIQAKYQAQAQAALQEAAPPPAQQEQAGSQPGQEQEQQQQEQPPPGAPQPQQQAPSPVVELYAKANTLSRQLAAMSEPDRYQALARLRAENPDLYMVINDRMASSGGAPPRQATAGGAGR